MYAKMQQLMVEGPRHAGSQLARSMTASSRISAAQAILLLLEKAGVRYIFGVPGGPLTGLFEPLAESTKIRLVLAKHEAGAAFMAASHARVSGQLSVCVATSGPGATNALTGLASAYCDSLPVLMLTGQVGTGVFGKGAIQESTVFGVDLTSIFRPVTKLSAMASSATTIPDLVQRGIRTALSGRRGPVHLSLPADMLRGRARMGLLDIPDAGLVPSGVSQEQISQILELLSEAERPCILAGHGVAVSGAQRELRAVVELSSATLLTSPKGKGLFSERHPNSLGVLGFGGHQAALDFFQNEMDLLLVVGSSMNEFVTNAWSIQIPDTAKLIQVDIDPTMLGNNYPTDIAVVGDARHVLAALAERLAESPRSMPVPKATPTAAKPPERDVVADSRQLIDPSQLVHELRAAMPDDALLFVDNGSSILWATRYFQVRRPNTYFIDLGLASMGSAVAGVVGGSLAAPDKRCVALVGDAAFAMNGFEVHTAVEEQLPIVWVVLNDGGHGMVRHGDTLMHGAPLGVSDYRVGMDLAAVARGLGADGERVATLSELRDALVAAMQRSGPTVIDARIDPKQIPPALIQRVQTLSKMLKAGQSVRPPLGG